MKKWNISITALVIAIAITLGWYIWYRMYSAFTTSNHSYKTYNQPVNDTAFGNLFASLNISDSVPYYVHKKAEDSLKKINDLRDYDNKGLGAGISTKSVGVVALPYHGPYDYSGLLKDAVYKSFEDSIKKLSRLKDTAEQKKATQKIKILTDKLLDRSNKYNIEVEEKFPTGYYFAIKNYELDYPNSFFIKNGNYNLAYVKLDTIINVGNGQTVEHWHFEHKRIPFRYGSNDNAILIPITYSRFLFLHRTIMILGIVLYLLFLYFFIGLPLQILFNISKGRAFNKKNIRYLKTMSFTAFLYYFINIGFIYSIRFIFRNLIPADFHPQSFIQVISDQILFLLTGIALFIIAKAFERGYNLQTEQDLTI